MKKFYAFAAAAMMALAANAQDGAPLYITGAGNFANGEWSAGNPDEFTYADGVYTIEVANLTQFKMSTVCDPTSGNGGWEGYETGLIGCNYGSKAGVTVDLEKDYGANMKTPWKGDYTITVAGDLSTITLTTDTPEPGADVLPVVYIKGDMNSWKDDDAWKMESISKTLFKFVCADGQSIAVGETFKFADSDWNDYNVGGDGNPIMLDTETEVYNGGNPANITLEEEFTGVVWLNLDVDGSAYVIFSNDKTFEPEWDVTEGGVSTISVDNTAAKYFNLQGVQVANPENGLYIVVKGNKATKVLVK